MMLHLYILLRFNYYDETSNSYGDNVTEWISLHFKFLKNRYKISPLGFWLMW